ncbi:hypothetical protein BU23DRAFT_571271 [Bimuria novae-zelandiae CBS 107.79]|uniref:Uncharacterized protein n=1 Tax=Bimuria novae-zelandiae CBS 107.79 TaxID=1447943 RepID=A0A6A5UYL9_9PLEO|nr:hypothetical protein BU23DRAFT_571271 [Bimuria novae-zelandiae CBS 107.79]
MAHHPAAIKPRRSVNPHSTPVTNITEREKMGATLTERDYIGIAFSVIVVIIVAFICYRVLAVAHSESRIVIARKELEGEAQSSGRVEMRDLERGEGSETTGADGVAEESWIKR